MAYTHFNNLSYIDKLAKGRQGSEIEIKPVSGVENGFKLARGSNSVTGNSEITTNLATVISIVACLSQLPDADATTVTARISSTAGNIILNVWKLVEGTPNTLGASTVAKTVHWIAIGT
jgi:hypothetical protein